MLRKKVSCTISLKSEFYNWKFSNILTHVVGDHLIMDLIDIAVRVDVLI